MRNRDMEFYAYRHNNGTIHTKRFFGDHGSIIEANASPFTKKCVGPFVAKDIDTARVKASRLLAA